MRVSLSSSTSPKKKSRSREREKLTIKKKGMTAKRSSGWSLKGWQANTGWKPGPLSTRGSQSSQELWSNAAPQGTKMERDHQCPVGNWTHDQRTQSHLSQKLQRKCKERRGPALIIAEELRTKGSKDDSNRSVLVQGLTCLKKKERRGIGAEKVVRGIAGKEEDPGRLIVEGVRGIHEVLEPHEEKSRQPRR